MTFLVCHNTAKQNQFQAFTSIVQRIVILAFFTLDTSPGYMFSTLWGTCFYTVHCF